ncbi:MAG: hypothetical protein IPP31_05270 [Chitinophagaceae bacterium]|nr:hypothetical protein [Chitinophagaceae bacterium]
MTPANRTYSWARYLHQFGIYSVIITRQWPAAFTGELYEIQSVGKELIIEKHNGYEVHYLPFRGNYLTRSFEKHGPDKQKTPRRIFLLLELFFKNTFRALLPYSNLYAYCLDYIRDHPVDKMLISGSPFQLFRIGFLAKRKYHVPWIADYRDGWTSGNHDQPKGILGKLERPSNVYHEKRWLRTADQFITVSPYLEACLSKTTGIRGKAIYNGFFNEGDPLPEKAVNKEEVTFLYSGSMYPAQDYRTLVDVFKKLIDTYRDKITVRLIFLGTRYKNDPFRQDPVFDGYREHFVLKDRVAYPEALRAHADADAFIMLAYQGAKGIPSSKIFDYIRFQKPVLLYPNDHDILESILTRSGLGLIADNAAGIEEKLDRLIREKLETGRIKAQPDKAYIETFSRENQVRVLAEFIKEKA